MISAGKDNKFVPWPGSCYAPGPVVVPSVSASDTSCRSVRGEVTCP